MPHKLVYANRLSAVSTTYDGQWMHKRVEKSILKFLQLRRPLYKSDKLTGVRLFVVLEFVQSLNGRKNANEPKKQLNHLIKRESVKKGDQ